jgi:hypothetical protein
VLAIGPEIEGSNPAEDDGFLRAIKILSTTCKILRIVKEPN